jgi:hypothetical protein
MNPPSRKFQFDASISWGDIGMAIGGLVFTLGVFLSLRDDVMIHNQRIGHAEKAVNVVAEDLRLHKTESLAADNQIKTEIKTELKDINDKLDRLVERELNRK